MEEKKSAAGNVIAKGIMWIVILATIFIIYLSVKLFYIGNTFR